MNTFEQEVELCVKLLSEGKVFVYPTDTIWGIGCDATNAEAVKKIYQLKQRADNKALIVLLDSVNHLDHYVIDVPEMAKELLDVAVKPLTIIYEGAFNVAKELLGENDSVGIRIPHEEFSQQLCERFGKPIVSTSANVSGEPAPSIFADITPDIKQAVDYVVKYRQDETAGHQASNIILLRSDGTFKIIR